MCVRNGNVGVVGVCGVGRLFSRRGLHSHRLSAFSVS